MKKKYLIIRTNFPEIMLPRKGTTINDHLSDIYEYTKDRYKDSPPTMSGEIPVHLLIKENTSNSKISIVQTCLYFNPENIISLDYSCVDMEKISKSMPKILTKYNQDKDHFIETTLATCWKEFSKRWHSTRELGCWNLDYYEDPELIAPVKRFYPNIIYAESDSEAQDLFKLKITLDS